MNDLIPTLSLIFRISAVTMLLILATIFIRRRDFRGISGVLLTLAVICYLASTSLRGPEVRNWFALPVRMGAATVAFWFYLFSRAIFSDGYFPRRGIWSILALQIIVSALLWFLFSERIVSSASDPLVAILILVQQLIALSFFITAIAFVEREGVSDLLEDRRSLRRRFTIVVGGYALVVVSVEVYMRGQCPPVLYDLINAGGLLAIVSVITLSVLTFRPAFLDDRPRKTLTDSNDSAEDQIFENNILRFMKDDRGYREESITIRKLALSLNIQEYKLRRIINGRLGFRNFNDFLNRYRIEEAVEILSDPERREVSIVRLAMDLGYGSLATFNRVFRAQTGTTPTSFRNTAQADRT